MTFVTKKNPDTELWNRADVYLEQGFKEKQDALEKESKWRLIEKTEPFRALPLEDPEILNCVFVYRVS